MSDAATPDPDALLDRARAAIEAHHPLAIAAFLSAEALPGSRSGQTARALVLYEDVERAWRHTAASGRAVVEFFVHDLRTLAYVLENVERRRSRPTLARLIADGALYPGPSTTSRRAAGLARLTLARGPAPLTARAIEDRRYALTTALERIERASEPAALIGAGAAIYAELADTLLRSRGAWGASAAKACAALTAHDPALGERFTEAFEALFARSESAPVTVLVAEALAPWGGALREGYHRIAPGTWRPSGAPRAQAEPARTPRARDEVRVTSPGDDYEARYRAEVERLRGVLGPQTLARFDHIGSTAIPESAGQPIVDILLITPRPSAVRAPLEGAGYVAWSGNAALGDPVYVRGMPPFGDERTSHILVRPGRDAWAAGCLAFRDALRDDPAKTAAYAALLRRAGADYADDRASYTREKSAFIEATLARLGGDEEE